MDTGTAVIIVGGVVVVGFVVYLASTNNAPASTTTPQQQAQPEGNAATQIAQGATQGLLSFLSRAASSNSQDSRTGNRDLGNGWTQTPSGWLLGPPART